MTPTTMQDPQVRPASELASTQKPVGRPMYSATVAKVREEAKSNGVKCSHGRARRTVEVLRRAVHFARRNDYKQVYILTRDELNTVHPVLDAIMPDVARDALVVPTPGSAWATAQDYLLEDGEFGIIHTRDGANACVIAVQVNPL